MDRQLDVQFRLDNKLLLLLSLSLLLLQPCLSSLVLCQVLPTAFHS